MSISLFLQQNNSSLTEVRGQVLLCKQLLVPQSSENAIYKETQRSFLPTRFNPSISDLGKLHLTNTKSDLLDCIGQPGLSDPLSTYE